jgi:hypothetical protein
MAAPHGHIDCTLYPSAFSGEVIFQVSTTTGNYEGVAPKHYAKPDLGLAETGINGQIKVRVLSNGGNEARVSTPDGEILTIPANKVHDK